MTENRPFLRYFPFLTPKITVMCALANFPDRKLLITSKNRKTQKMANFWNAILGPRT